MSDSLRKFIPYPDQRLRTICTPVEKITEDIHAIWQDMMAAMYAMPGVGLAANQIGILQRLAVVDCSEKKNEPVCMANPEILQASIKSSEYSEASPNLPGVSAMIARPRAVTVGFMDQFGQQVEHEIVGLWATSVQHQIDHLNGKMYFDHLSPVKRKMLLAKAAKLARREAV